MTIIPSILIALLIAGTLAVVLRPLFQGAGGRWPGVAADPTALSAAELAARRDAIYAALKDAEFDRETGKLADEDYQDVRARYMAEAADVLRRLDRLTPQAEAALDADIERAVAALRSNGKRASLPEDVIQEVEAEIASLVKHVAAADKRALACPDCGRAYQPGDTYCAACGASLADTCPQCGAPHQPDDIFCSRCGAALGEGVKRDG